MDNNEFNDITQLNNCQDDQSDKNISSLIDQLRSPNNSIRIEAREALSCVGAPAIPELLETFKKSDLQMRWQIIKIMDNIQDPSTIPLLIEQLKDENSEIRWAASNALINMRREAVPAVLQAITRDFDSIWMRQSTHHILRVLRDYGKLTPIEENVCKALEEIEPSVSAPWAAEKALEALNRLKKYPPQS